VFTVQPKVQPIAPNKKLYVHTGSLKTHHCEGFIKLHKIDPLCPKGLTSEIGFRVYVFKNPPYSMYIVLAYITKFIFTRKCIWHVNCKVIPFDKYITFDKYSIKIIM
jgi:hypothetical protein